MTALFPECSRRTIRFYKQNVGNGRARASMVTFSGTFSIPLFRPNRELLEEKHISIASRPSPLIDSIFLSGRGF